MMHLLDGCKLKLGRAYYHLNTLNNAVQRVNGTDACTLVPEFDEETGEGVIRVKVLKAPPVEWAVIVGEVAHNLRSALDHMVWQLALKQATTPMTGRSSPSRRTRKRALASESPLRCLNRRLERSTSLASRPSEWRARRTRWRGAPGTRRRRGCLPETRFQRLLEPPQA